jgi:hypothetical protein
MVTPFALVAILSAVIPVTPTSFAQITAPPAVPSAL